MLSPARFYFTFSFSLSYVLFIRVSIDISTN
nr:MAG TPA: hypothetical protein [Caudoviricetes sp.]